MNERMELLQLVNRYREAKAAMDAKMRAIFPLKMAVWISQSRPRDTKGHVAGIEDDGVGCLLENGNVWYYPIEKVEKREGTEQ